MTRHTLPLLCLLILAQATPAAAPRVSDKGYFALWMMQVQRGATRVQLERLPCRQWLASCAALLDTASAAHKPRTRGGKVDPFAMRHKVKTNLGRRVSVAGRRASLRSTATPALAAGNAHLLLSESGRRRLSVDLDAPDGAVNDLQALGEYVAVATTASNVPGTLAAANGGVGDSAYGALYDFDDEGGSASPGSFRELPSVLGASTVAVAAAVAEPRTLALFVVGLFAWQCRGGLRRRVAPRSA